MFPVSAHPCLEALGLYVAVVCPMLVEGVVEVVGPRRGMELGTNQLLYWCANWDAGARMHVAGGLYSS
jgi:hypothetical protein